MKSKTFFLVGITSLAGLVLAAATAYLFRWWTAIFNTIPCLGGIFGIVLALVTLLRLLRARAIAKPGLNKIEQACFLASIFLLFQLAYFPISSAFRDLEVARAQAFSEALIPEIEEYERQHDKYPDDISVILPPNASLPPLFRLSGTLPYPYDNRQFYSQRGPSYGFRFYLPDGFIGYSYEYCCGAHGKWTVTD